MGVELSGKREAVDKALGLKADFVEALTFKGLLLRLQANVEKDAGKQQALLKEPRALELIRVYTSHDVLIRRENGVQVRVVSETSPAPEAQRVSPSLEDVYLHLVSGRGAVQ